MNHIISINNQDYLKLILASKKYSYKSPTDFINDICKDSISDCCYEIESDMLEYSECKKEKTSLYFSMVENFIKDQGLNESKFMNVPLQISEDKYNLLNHYSHTNFDCEIEDYLYSYFQEVLNELVHASERDKEKQYIN